MSCFFFQAEDGIRDRTVTGVQTCALPISLLQKDSRRRVVLVGRGGDEFALEIRQANPELQKQIMARSEERRVGKECRARWSRDEEKKKKKDGNDSQKAPHTANTLMVQ